LKEVSAGSLHRRDLRIHPRLDGIPFLDLGDSFVKLQDWLGLTISRPDFRRKV
jgi:hypothetical protein